MKILSVITAAFVLAFCNQAWCQFHVPTPGPSSLDACVDVEKFDVNSTNAFLHEKILDTLARQDQITGRSMPKPTKVGGGTYLPNRSVGNPFDTHIATSYSYYDDSQVWATVSWQCNQVTKKLEIHGYVIGSNYPGYVFAVSSLGGWSMP